MRRWGKMTSDERDAGLRRQLEDLDRKLAAGAGLAGWKVGLTSGASRDAMGVGFRPFGHILAERVFPSGATLTLRDFNAIGVENEVCFTIGATLAGEVSVAAAKAAVASAAPGFEINEPRLDGTASAAARLADNLSQWGVVAGAERPLAGIDFEALEVALERDGATQARVFAHGHIDDHFASIAALAAQLARFGRRLEPGQRVITGAFGRCPVTAPSRWCGDFGAALGVVEVAFA